MQPAGQVPGQGVLRRRSSAFLYQEANPQAALAALAALPAAPAALEPPPVHLKPPPRHRARFEKGSEWEDNAKDPWTVEETAATLEHILHAQFIAHKPRRTIITKDGELERMERRGQREQQRDLEIARSLEAVGHLAEELDGLLAVMGRLTVTARVGQMSALQLAAGTPRTVEVKLPKAPEESRYTHVSMLCRCVHGAEDQGSPPEFDLLAADTQQRASAGGPFRAQSRRKANHRVHFSTDAGSVFVNLCARKECHVEFLCRAGTGSGPVADAASSDGSSEDEAGLQKGTGVSKGLQAKLQLRRQELLSKPQQASNSSSSAFGVRRGKMGQKNKGPKTADDAQEAQSRVIRIWLSSSSKNPHRPKGQWVKSLSPDFPRKLMRWLRREAQERAAMQCLAVVGSFAFLLKRQRELHVMRARTALRQHIWYKALFAASRLRMVVAFASRGREAAREAPGKKRGQQVRRRSLDASSLSIVEQVRRHVDTFGNTARHAPPARPPGPPLPEPRSLQEQLASQGFKLHPYSPGSGKLGAGGDSSHHHGSDRRPSAAWSRQTAFLKHLSGHLGRKVRPDKSPALPALEAVEDCDHETAEEITQELKSRMLQVTLRDSELKTLGQACPVETTDLMSSKDFKRYSHRVSLALAQDVTRRRAQEQQEPEASPPAGPTRITKRYLLRFFDNEPRDVPWLPMLQSLMLVIHGHATFHTPFEHRAVEENLRFFKEARRNALRRPGAFPPLEAVLWSHPVILQLAIRLQKSMIRGDSATAWKGSVFEGCYESSSGRDTTGASLSSAAPEGGGGQLVLRRLVDVAGQFELGTGSSSPLPSAELTPHQPDCIAMRTASGHPVRTFGDKQGPTVHTVLRRRSNHTLEMPPDSGERTTRMEALRQQRREREVMSVTAGSNRSQFEDLLEDSELKAQQRYGDWMMRTEVPQRERAFKARLKPYFEGLSSTYPLGSDMGSASAPSPSSARGGERLFTSEGLYSSNGMTANTSGTAVPPELGSTADPPPESRISSLPQTVEEVGKLVEQSDALRTILGMDKAEHGGFANRCPAGWNSGYREGPMSKEEIRRARIVEKCLTPRRHRSAGAPHTVR